MNKPSAFQQVMQMAQEKLSPAFQNARLWGAAFGFNPPISKQQQDADTYQKVVEARQLQAMGQIHDDPRNNNSIYKGLISGNSPGVVLAAKTSRPTKRLVNPTATPTPSPTFMPTATPAPTSFEAMAMPILQKYGIPPEVAFGMRDAEGGKIGANNVYNIGAVDSKPTAAANYVSPQEGVEAYAKLLSGKYQLANGQFDTRYLPAYELRSNPVAMLRKIVELGYAGDPATWKQRSMATGGAGQYYDNYRDFVMDTPGWKKHHKSR